MVHLKGTTPVEATRGMMKDKYIFLHPSKYLTLGAFTKLSSATEVLWCFDL